MSVRTIRGNGRYPVAAFGAKGKGADESNAAKWWSTVYLAITELMKAACKREGQGELVHSPVGRRLPSKLSGEVYYRPKAAVPRQGSPFRLCTQLLAGRGKDKLPQEQ